MADYPKDPMPIVQEIQSYIPNLPALSEEDQDKVTAAIEATLSKTSPVVKIVEAFEALRPHVADLDLAGARILAGAAELIALHNFHGKNVEALGVRDAAIARLEALA